MLRGCAAHDRCQQHDGNPPRRGEPDQGVCVAAIEQQERGGEYMDRTGRLDRRRVALSDEQGTEDRDVDDEQRLRSAPA